MIHSFLNRLFLFALFLLPHHLLSKCVHWLTRIKCPFIKNFLIRIFIRHFKVDMTIARTEDPATYQDFNSFFTRALKPEARSVVGHHGAIVCPVDGKVSQAGQITQGKLFQAKGHDYHLEALLGGSQDLVRLFDNGCFATLYLSPRDYHRIHMPLTGRLLEMCYIPGRLYSVNELSVRYVPGLFARNERVVTVFDTDAGPMAVIMVGALFVSSIETVWAGDIARLSGSRLQRWDYRKKSDNAVTLNRGQEMARFNMGSTVIVMFDSRRATLAQHIAAGAGIRYGELLGNYK